MITSDFFPVLTQNDGVVVKVISGSITVVTGPFIPPSTDMHYFDITFTVQDGMF